MPTEIGIVVGEAMTLLKATLPASIEIVTEIAPDLPTVLADPTQVHQVVMNLCTNAWHAMQDQQGRLEVRLDRLVADVDFVEAHPELTAGSYARLSISDTGHGMAEEVRRRAIDPFFTTKPQGKGTGLGLSMTFGYVRQSAGHLVIQSAPGEGTAMTILMPRDHEVPRETGGAIA